jgi:tripartite-type tricarboxylate transporter receptor subunit TctC
MMRNHLRSFALALAAGGMAASPAPAQTGADFYKGKTVTYIVSTAPGGGFDLYGRMVSEYMQKYLPGSTFVVKNIPGAGHLIGANTIYASKPDGLTIGTFTTGLLYNQIVKLDGVQFDLEKMSWIGKASSDPRVLTLGAQVPIKSYQELQANKQTLNFSTSGIGSAAYVETVMLTRALKLPAKILTCYQGTDDHLAIRRGEVQASISSRSSWEPFVKNGYGHFVFQIGGNQPDVPQLAGLVTDPAAQALVALVQSQGDISRLTAGPPAIPEDRLEALRTAYRKSMEDPEMQAKAAKLERPLEPAYGEDVRRMVKAALTQSPETVALLKQALEAPKEAAAPATKGAVADWDGRSKILLKLDDGKTFAAEVSGSRTEVTVGGQKAAREAIKLGMTCAIVGPASGEAKSVTCN